MSADLTKAAVITLLTALPGVNGVFDGKPQPPPWDRVPYWHLELATYNLTQLTFGPGGLWQAAYAYRATLTIGQANIAPAGAQATAGILAHAFLVAVGADKTLGGRCLEAVATFQHGTLENAAFILLRVPPTLTWLIRISEYGPLGSV